MRRSSRLSGAKLYFTSDRADRPIVDVPAGEEDVSGTLAEFDETVARIEAHDFATLADDVSECEGCPFAAYCGRG